MQELTLDETVTTFVSVVMPIYNEGRYLVKCMESLLKQDFSRSSMEWILVDGGSTDGTRAILENYRKKYPDLIVLADNPKKTVPCAMNIGIKLAKGDYIIRLDAHAEYEYDYIRKCVFYLDTVEADNVGGVIETKSQGEIGEAIAMVLSSRFGVGNSNFRVHGKNGYVDTVPFGAFHREVFERLGGYDERLTRNEDNEMNYRIQKNGGKIYMSNDIQVSYYCRDTVKGIMDMALQNGMWNVITMKLCPGSMGIRHFVPFTFFLSIVFLLLLSVFRIEFMYFLSAEIALYFILDLIFTLKLMKNGRLGLLMFFLFPLFHLTYGFGSLIGLIKICGKSFRE